MRNATPAILIAALGCALLACARAEGNGEAETRDAEPASEVGADKPARYRITHRYRSEFANKGLVADVLYEAELRPDPDNPDELKGTGRYKGKLIERKVSIPECDEPPKERMIEGNIEASGNASEMPDLKGALGLPSKDKSTDFLSGGRVMNYMLATTDWPPPAGASAEDAEAVKGSGTVSQLALKLNSKGKVTEKHDAAPGIHGGNCLGANTVTQDIKVEELAP